ncbi:MAG: hypothetical protein SF029_18520 [bacterium]|nr:hypothetical protein [bacterium]
MSSVSQPPPIDEEIFDPPHDPFPDEWFSSPPPEPPAEFDYDPMQGYDPFARDTPDFIPIPDDDVFVPKDGSLPNLPDVPPLSQDGLQGFEAPEPTDAGWSWHDARLIGVERAAETGVQYEIGCIDVYANVHSGDLGGSYLPIATLDDVDAATHFYHDLEAEIHQQALPNYAVPQFAEAVVERSGRTPEWVGAAQAEYEAYDYLRDLETGHLNSRDEPPDQAIDPLIETARQLGGVIAEREMEGEALTPEDRAAFQALNAIGIEADGFDPSQDPPPFYDAQTGTAYWIGVFQPDKDDTENCITSILSLGRNPDTGEVEAQLAPCVPGDWDKAYRASEFLIDVAQKGGIERCFDAAEGMALATDQRDLWENERGVPLDTGVVQDIADYTRETWEVEL